MLLSNLHTHTHYCDGKNSPEEIVCKAISLGFNSIGFSGHSFTRITDDCCMTESGTSDYICEINFLKERYKNEIEIFLGIEEDFYSEISSYKTKLDYIIGAVHDLYDAKKDKYYPIDYTSRHFETGLLEISNGNIRDFVKRYYKTVEKMAATRKPPITAHYDLIKKLNINNKYFNENDEWYRQVALEPLKILKASGTIMEINTGAMSRGYDLIYPSEFILKEACVLGIPIIVGSDSHSVETLNYGFGEALRFVRSVGYTSVKQFKNREFIDINIETISE